jgi:hypothetical protein
LLARIGGAHWFVGNTKEAVEWSDRGLDVAEALQLPEILCRGWAAKAMAAAPRRPEEARGFYQLALETALKHELHERAASTYSNLSDLGFQRDRYVDSLAALEQALALSHKIGDRGQEWFALSEMTYVFFMLGRWDEALARLAEIPADQIGPNANLVSPLTGVLEIHLHRGELDEARELLSRFEEIGASSDIQAQYGYQAAAAAVRLAEGNPRGALSAAEHAFQQGRTTLGIAAQGVKQGFWHGLEAAVALGDRATAEELLATVEDLPVGLRPPLLDATAHRFRAQLAGDSPVAEEEFVTAAADLRRLRLPFHLAVVLLEHGEWLLTQSRHGESAPLRAEARETFEHLRAQPWLDRIDAAEASATAEVSA